MGIRDLPIVKKTLSIRRHKNPAYKKAFLPQRWDKMFQARIAFRPRPTYLFRETAKIKKGPMRASTRRLKAVMASTNIDREASVMRGRRAPRRGRKKRGPKKEVYLL